MAGKTIHDYTDEELSKLSAVELADLRGDHNNLETDEEREARLAEEKRLADEAEAERLRAEAAAAAAKNGELDPEEVARLAAEADGGGEGAGKFVPHARFQEVNAERKLLLEEIIRLRGGAKADPPVAAPAPPPYDFKAKRKEYHELLLEDPAKAALLADEIEEAREAQHKADLERVRRETTEEVMSSVGQQRTNDHLETTAQSLYQKYPFLNHKGPEADATAIYAVIGQRDELVRAGMDPVEAMAQAAEEVGSKFAKLLGRGAAAPAPAAGDPNARKVEETRRAADAANRQPPTNQGGIGNRDTSGTLNIKDMTDEQLLELARKSPDELAKMRGDNRIPA